MPAPLVGAAVAAAARVIAKKLSQRAVGGITGVGAKSFNPVYKNTGSTIKVNSNPNKTPAKGQRNPTQTKLDRAESLDPVYDKYGYPSKKVIKINSK
jgi:hypothetical protein